MSDITFGSLTKIETAPRPTYIWTINDKAIELTSKQILNQRLFHMRMIEELNIWPPMLKPSDWNNVIRKALSTMEIFGSRPKHT